RSRSRDHRHNSPPTFLIVRSTTGAHLHPTRRACHCEIGLAPRILSAAGTTEIRFRIRPPLLARPWRAFEIELPPRCGEALVALVGPAAGDNVVIHVLAGFFAAHHPGRGRLQTVLFHLRRPLFVVIAAFRCRASGLLPSMVLLMHQCRADVLVALADEAVG